MKNKVKKIIDDWDPADLLCIHCPPDEYEGEIEEIVKKLPSIENTVELAKVIQDTFTKYFGEEYSKWDYKQCLVVAERIIDS